ncbi:MAG: putative ABC transporter permease [Clostridia bacterium]|nr:putative ABC transporter permease [Clostridia bacterium]
MDIKEHSQKRAIPHVPANELFWLFLIGSIVGFVLEGIWSVVRLGVWENHSATVWGPFCIVYGLGMALIYSAANLLKDKSAGVQFLLYGLIGSAIEFFASIFQEVFFGATSWNYNDHFLNLGGRVSLQMTLIWGTLGVLFTRFVFPYVAMLLQKMQGRGWRLACICLSVYMGTNLLVTAAAIMRWRERMEDIPASNPAEEILDNVYDNEKMASIFSNMEFLE